MAESNVEYFLASSLRENLIDDEGVKIDKVFNLH